MLRGMVCLHSQGCTEAMQHVTSKWCHTHLRPLMTFILFSIKFGHWTYRNFLWLPSSSWPCIQLCDLIWESGDWVLGCKWPNLIFVWHEEFRKQDSVHVHSTVNQSQTWHTSRCQESQHTAEVKIKPEGLRHFEMVIFYILTYLYNVLEFSCSLHTWKVYSVSLLTPDLKQTWIFFQKTHNTSWHLLPLLRMICAE